MTFTFNFKWLWIATAISVFLVASLSIAAPFPANVTNDVYSPSVNGIPTANYNNDGVPDIYDAINQLIGTAYTNNQQADSRLVDAFSGADNVWTNITGTTILIGLTASNSNTLGTYTDIGTGSAKTSVIGPYSGFGFSGDGSLAHPYPAGLTSLGSGVQFGWYLNSSGTNYYSEPNLNPGGWDHMMTFSLPDLAGKTVYIKIGNTTSQYTFGLNPYLITWEDLPYDSGKLGDEDYDDMIYLVDKVSVPTVPEPATMLLLGSGLVGLAGYGRKKFLKK